MIEVFNSRVTLAAPQPRGRGVRGALQGAGHRRLRQPLQLRDRHELQRAAASSRRRTSCAGPFPMNDWHGSRSTVFIHLTTRWAVWSNMVRSWSGQETATAPVLGPETPEQVEEEPIERPTPAELPDPKDPEASSDRIATRRRTAAGTRRAPSPRASDRPARARSLRSTSRASSSTRRPTSRSPSGGQPAPARAQLAHDRLDHLRAGPRLLPVPRRPQRRPQPHRGAGPIRERRPACWPRLRRLLPDLPVARLPLVVSSCANVGTRVRYGDATEILFMSWFVNCLVPAKLGDLYRAYLLRATYARLDLADGRHDLHRAHRRHHRDLRPGAGGRLLELPRPDRPEVDALFLARLRAGDGPDHLRGGAALLRPASDAASCRRAFARPVRALPRGQHRRMRPRVAAAGHRRHDRRSGCWRARASTSSSTRWTCRLSHLGISSSIFVALGASLLTAIPLTPGGIGFVQAGIVGVAADSTASPAEHATAVALIDCVISMLSVIVIGGIVYAFSARCAGRTEVPRPTVPG